MPPLCATFSDNTSTKAIKSLFMSLIRSKTTLLWLKKWFFIVDPEDRPLGTMEKMEAHRQGVLHRAFVCVFVFNSKGDLLLHGSAACQ